MSNIFTHRYADDDLCLGEVVERDLTPPQQFALLNLMGHSDLAVAVRAKMRSSTARDGVADRDAIVARGWARRGHQGRLRLTDVGIGFANALARYLVRKFQIKISPRRPRGGFRPGLFSQAGNW